MFHTFKSSKIFIDLEKCNVYVLTYLQNRGKNSLSVSQCITPEQILFIYSLLLIQHQQIPQYRWAHNPISLSQTQKYTPGPILQICVWSIGINLITWKKPTQTQEEHTNSMQ